MSSDATALTIRVLKLIGRITLARTDRWIEADKTETGQVWFEIVARRPDIDTGKVGIGRGGKRFVTDEMSDSTIVRSIFGALASYEEHECREGFAFDGKRIFGPHISVQALIDIADRRE
jgi:hypothetical protein